MNVDDHPVRKAVMTGKAVTSQLVAVRNPGAHQLRWMLVNAEPLLREDGNLYMAICTYHDITERKHAEELRAAYEKLKKETEEREKAERHG
jgi:PAS domain S-box-containing protein